MSWGLRRPSELACYRSRHDIEENSPTRRDGVEAATEKQWRLVCVDWLLDVGKRLKMPMSSIATAIILCHRYFGVRSMVKNDKLLVCTACLYTASKVDDCPQHLIDIIRAFEHIKWKDSGQVRDGSQQQYEDSIRTAVLVAERALLYAIGFRLYNIQPYRQLLHHFKRFNIDTKTDDLQIQALCQAAWNFLNDSLRTTLCLQYPNDVISFCCLVLAFRLLEVQLPDSFPPDDQIWQDVPESVFIDVSDQIMELYEPSDMEGGERMGPTASGGPLPGRPQWEGSATCTQRGEAYRFGGVMVEINGSDVGGLKVGVCGVPPQDDWQDALWQQAPHYGFLAPPPASSEGGVTAGGDELLEGAEQ